MRYDIAVNKIDSLISSVNRALANKIIDEISELTQFGYLDAKEVVNISSANIHRDLLRIRNKHRDDIYGCIETRNKFDEIRDITGPIDNRKQVKAWLEELETHYIPFVSRFQ